MISKGGMKCFCYSFPPSGGATMTSEMQEIAITEDKPLLTGQADAAKVRHSASDIKYHIHCTGKRISVAITLRPNQARLKSESF